MIKKHKHFNDGGIWSFQIVTLTLIHEQTQFFADQYLTLLYSLLVPYKESINHANIAFAQISTSTALPPQQLSDAI